MLALFVFLLLLPLTLLVMLPVTLALLGTGNLLALPGQMLRVMLSKQRRRNHALEHATVNVLEQRYGAQLLIAGFAEADGFFIRGLVTPQVVLDAAREGLDRLQAGEVALALHPRCGTMLVSGQLIAALTFVMVLLFSRNVSFGMLVSALLLAMAAARLLARPIGLFLQRTLMTSTKVQNMHIDRLDAQLPEHPLALVLSAGQPTQFKVWTRESSAEAQPTGPKRYKAY